MIITERNYEICLRRLGELEEQILEVNTLLAEPGDCSWCLGDPNELLSALQIERDEIQLAIDQFVKSLPEHKSSPIGDYVS